MTDSVGRLRAGEVLSAANRFRPVLAAVLAAAAVATALAALSPRSPAGVPVLTARHDLPAGRALAAGDLAEVQLPRAAVPAGALSRVEQAAGRLLAGPVRRGEPLTDVRLAGAGLLTQGAVGLLAVPVRLADAASAALLQAGDRVDVLAAATSPGAPAAAETVATAVPVLAVPQGFADGAVGDGALVVLATTPATAARLAAAAVSSRLSVALRAAG